MPRDKLPARSVMRRYERQAQLDRQAIAECVCPQCRGFDDYCADVPICETCHGHGKLEVPAFCAAMARLLEAEERQEAVRKVAPLLVGA